MTLEELLEICEAYLALGWAVQDQAASIIGGGSLSAQNKSALAMIHDWLADLPAEMEGAAELAREIRECLEGEEE